MHNLILIIKNCKLIVIKLRFIGEIFFKNYRFVFCFKKTIVFRFLKVQNEWFVSNKRSFLEKKIKTKRKTIVFRQFLKTINNPICRVVNRF